MLTTELAVMYIILALIIGGCIGFLISEFRKGKR